MESKTYNKGDAVSFQMIHQTGLNDYSTVTKWHDGVVIDSNSHITVVEANVTGKKEMIAFRTKDLHEPKGEKQ